MQPVALCEGFVNILILSLHLQVCSAIIRSKRCCFFNLSQMRFPVGDGVPYIIYNIVRSTLHAAL